MRNSRLTYFIAMNSVVSLSLTACSVEPLVKFKNDPVGSENSILGAQPAARSAQEKTSATHVAILGDSQSTGLYGQRLFELIRYTSKQKISYFGAASSARIGSWIHGGFYPIPINAYFGCDAKTETSSCTPSTQTATKTESINSILSRHPYVSLYIITLGDNHFYDPASVKNELPRLIKPILTSGANCVFVTPTEGLGQFSNKLTLIANLKSAIGSLKTELGRTCTLIDSYTVGKDVLRNESDLQMMRDSVSQDPMKLHPRGPGAKLWAERVFDALKQQELLNPL